MKKLIIFGTNDIAELAYFYFKNESSYEVVAFTVDKEFIRSETFIDGLPVVPLEVLSSIYSPKEFEVFVAISYAKMNQVRKNKYLGVQRKGLSIGPFY